MLRLAIVMYLLSPSPLLAETAIGRFDVGITITGKSGTSTNLKPAATGTLVNPTAISTPGAIVGSTEWLAYCSSRYRSFNPATGVYFGTDGEYHFCR